MTTTRKPGWQAKLSDLVQERMTASFVWGVNDCCMFAADCTEAITGADPASAVRGKYDSAQTASDLLRELGGVERVAESWFGEEVPVALAQVGDVVLVNQDGRETLSVHAGAFALAPGKDELVRIPLVHALKAWRCTRQD